jgi:hypothetical protein
MYVNGKMRPLETTPSVGTKEIRENDGGGELKFDMLLRTFVNVTLYPQYNSNKKTKKFEV